MLLLLCLVGILALLAFLIAVACQRRCQTCRKPAMVGSLYCQSCFAVLTKLRRPFDLTPDLPLDRATRHVKSGVGSP